MPVRPHRHSIFCIIPPAMLRSLAEHGNAEQRRVALETLSLDTSFRSMRAIAALSHPIAPPGVLGEKRRTIYDARNGQTLPGTVVRTEGSRAGKDTDRKSVV